MAQGICFLCGNWEELETHHVFQGALRKKATKYKLTVKICRYCHQYDSDSAHRSRETRMYLRKWAQAKAMKEQGWSVGDFIREFERNYLDEDEIAALYDTPQDDGHFAPVTEEVELPW